MKVMETGDWSDPQHALTAAFTVLRSPIDDTLDSLSAVLAGLVPHRALAMLTGDCGHSSVHARGEQELAEKVTAAELTRVGDVAGIDRPWSGRAAFAGASRPLLVVVSEATGSGPTLLAIVLNDDAAPAGAAQGLVQRLWDLTTLQLATLVSRADPVMLARNLLASGERAKAVTELTEAHAASLTALLGALRSRTLDDASARRTAIDLAVSALIRLRAGDQGPGEETAEQTAAEAFARLAQRLGPLTRHGDVTLEFVPPGPGGRVLPGEIIDTAHAVVRGAVLISLAQDEVGRIRVAWEVDDSGLRITVRDDGPGALTGDAPAVLRLNGRLVALGGALKLEAIPGWGTTFTAGLPLSPPELPDAHPLAGLNPRELDVARQLTRGLRNRQIAEQLHISENTVKFHVANILDKLGVHSRGEVSAIARDAGLTPPSRQAIS